MANITNFLTGTFNSSPYFTWEAALATLTRLQKKVKPGDKLRWDLVEAVVAEDGSFELRCKHCHQHCQLKNPRKFVGGEHKCKGTRQIQSLLVEVKIGCSRVSQVIAMYL